MVGDNVISHKVMITNVMTLTGLGAHQAIAHIALHALAHTASEDGIVQTFSMGRAVLAVATGIVY